MSIFIPNYKFHSQNTTANSVKLNQAWNILEVCTWGPFQGHEKSGHQWNGSICYRSLYILQYYTTECHPTAGLDIYTYSITQLSVIRQQGLVYTLTVLHSWLSVIRQQALVYTLTVLHNWVSSDSRPWYIHLQYYTTECHPTAGFGIYMLGLKCAVSGYACSLFMSCVETGKSEDLYICNKGSKYFLWNT